MPTFNIEFELYDNGYKLVAGIDEAGRGPLAGPLVAGAVIFPRYLDSNLTWLENVQDSKKLSPKIREIALNHITSNAIDIGIGLSYPHEIDKVGIVKANKLAMLRSVGNLKTKPDYLLIDFVTLEDINIPYCSITHGDSKSYSIAAASIVAKVERDRILNTADDLYPGYGFRHNKGYGTPEHIRLLKQLGRSPIHRLSFHPVNLMKHNHKNN